MEQWTYQMIWLCLIKNVFDHDKALKMAIERLKKYGLTLNKPKCEFNKQQIGYFSMMFPERGMEPSPGEIKAVVNMGVPKTKEGVQSLLCWWTIHLVSYPIIQR